MTRRGPLLPAAFLIVAAATRGRPAAAAPPDRREAPAFSLQALDGRPLTLARFRGKVVLLNFWATWCAPCREEMPEFVATQARDGAKGVQFVGIAVDDPGKVRAFAKELKLNYPALIGGFGAIELSKTLGNDLAALPFTIVLDRQGRVAHTQLGPLEQVKLDALLGRLL